MSLMETAPFGSQLKAWRQRRRMSQLDLACEAEISTRHLSFLETGRARPSREMVLRLADHLAAPQREKNLLLVSAGYAPAIPERPLDDPAMASARRAVELILAAYEPYPALAVDRHWMLVAANAAMGRLLGGAPDGPVNVLKVGLDPDGLGRDIVNYREWRGHILERLRAQVQACGDAVLAALHDELAAYAEPPPRSDVPPATDLAGVAVPFRLASPAGVLSFFSATTVFGTPVDITLSEIAIESFLPADAATAQAMRAMAT